MNLSLVYLSYIPFGEQYLESFLDSYKTKKAGTDHQLVIMFNGHSDEEELVPFIKRLNASGVSHTYICSPEKFDIASYFYAAGKLETEFIAFVNTYSVILHDNWLLYLYQNLSKPDIGCVSATGSWGDFTQNDEYKKLVKELHHFRFTMAGLKKIIFFKFNLYPCVKPHLRTNAFMIRRTLFTGMRFGLVKPRLLNLFFNISGSKLKSLCFEHGNNGFTSQLIQKGLKPLIVDKNGKGYEVEHWSEARTFWMGQQENLMVSDNQTQKYQQADANEKKKRTYAAWGIVTE